MTYQEIVNRVQDIVNQHKMLADFGYGDISDLKTRFENTSGDSAVQADYPYLFLTPGTHSRDQGMITYNFNMIVMDMARQEVSDEPYNNTLAIQSQCQQYIDDVLAYLYFGYKDSPNVIYSGSTYNPFNERFQDDVAGMTLSLTIQVPQPIDNCVTPFTPPPVPPVLVLDVNSTSNQTFSPDVSGSPQAYQETIVDTYSGMRPEIANLYYIQSPETGYWVFTETGQARKLSGDGFAFIEPRILTVRPSSGGTGAEYPVQPTTSTFPTNSPIGTIFDYTVTWELELDPALIDYVAIQDYNDPVTEPQYETLSGLNLTATFTTDTPEPTEQFVVEVKETGDQIITPDGELSQTVDFRNTIIDNGPGSWLNNYYYVTQAATWTWVMEGYARAVDQQDPGGTWPTTPQIRIIENGPNPPTQYITPSVSNWPQSKPVRYELFPFKIEWNSNDMAAGRYFWEWQNPETDMEAIEFLGGVTLKGYYRAL